MKTDIRISLTVLLLLILILLVSGCERRPIDYEYTKGALVKINIDWSGVNPIPEHIKAVFYPTDGGSPIPRYMEAGQPFTYVPHGDYYVSLYNWRVNDAVQRVRFGDENNYYSFNAFTDFIKLRTFTGDILAQPDNQLYAWSSDDKIISISEIDKKEYSIEALAVSSSDVIIINTKPVSLIQTYSFFIPVEGMKCISGGEAVISGATKSKTLHNNKMVPVPYDLAMTLSPAENGIKCSFNTFGFVPGLQYVCKLNLIMGDGTTKDYTFDLTDEINSGKINDFTTTIAVECSDNGSGFNDPGIDEWNEENEYIDA